MNILSLLLPCLLLSMLLLASCSGTQQPKHQFQEWQSITNNFSCRPVASEAMAKEDDSILIQKQQEAVYPITEDDNIWHRIQAGLYLNYVNHPSVVSELSWYVNHPKYLQRVQQRASRYLYFIVEALHDEHIPYDIALLPIVESSYEPFSYSHGQASGLWQFIPITGQRFKLGKNWWYDGRRDPVDSTKAAIKYLKYLHSFFNGDWLLAIAAYNAGEGTVRKAVRKNKKLGKPTDFWHLDLPKETSAYVPKMIALAQIFRQPEVYNIPLVSIKNKPHFGLVALEEQLDLQQAATLAETSIEEIYYLNAGLNRWATPPNNHYSLKLPIDSIQTFKSRLTSLAKDQRVTWKQHKIKPGDTLSGIAQSYHSDKISIKRANRLKNNTIVAGKTLLIPSASEHSSAYSYSHEQRLDRKQNKAPRKLGAKTVYHVQSGDSFWKIAKDHNISVSSLASWNNKSPKDTLKKGEKLVIWSQEKFTSNPPNQRSKMRHINYTVRQGDSLAKIASKFNVSVAQIITWNKINPKKYLQPGQALTLFIDIMDSR